MVQAGFDPATLAYLYDTLQKLEYNSSNTGVTTVKGAIKYR
jgi:hypothetical protein